MAGVKWVIVISASAIHSASRPGVPISSGVGTYRRAPKNSGVSTGNFQLTRDSFIYYGKRLTISLNRIVGNSAEHGEPGVLSNTKALSHPWKVVRKAPLSSLYAFGYASASARERQRADAVWAQ